VRLPAPADSGSAAICGTRLLLDALQILNAATPAAFWRHFLEGGPTYDVAGRHMSGLTRPWVAPRNGRIGSVQIFVAETRLRRENGPYQHFAGEPASAACGHREKAKQVLLRN